MLKRTLTGIVLIIAVVGVFFLRSIDIRFFNLLAYFCAVIGTFEMVRALKGKLTYYQSAIAVGFSVTLVPVFTFFGFKLTIIVIFVAVVLMCLSLVFEFLKTDITNTALGIFAIVYPTLFLFPLLMLNSLPEHSFEALVLVFIISPFSDSCAYFVGSLLKGKKMSPNISPKKTISGAIGGLLGGTLGAVLLWAFFFKNTFGAGGVGEFFIFFGVGLVGSALTELGDLLEGAIKRKLQIKDMGSIFPGHGGVLDRIDGIMLASMFVYLYLLIFI